MRRNPPGAIHWAARQLRRASRVTRDHDDIDIAASRSDQDMIKVALQSNGWRHTPGQARLSSPRSWSSSWMSKLAGGRTALK